MFKMIKKLTKIQDNNIQLIEIEIFKFKFEI